MHALVQDGDDLPVPVHKILAHLQMLLGKVSRRPLVISAELADNILVGAVGHEDSGAVGVLAQGRYVERGHLAATGQLLKGVWMNPVQEEKDQCKGMSWVLAKIQTNLKSLVMIKTSSCFPSSTASWSGEGSLAAK